MRNVYDHPTAPGMLIKTIRPDAIDASVNFLRLGWLKRWRRPGAYFPVVRETAEYLAQARRRHSRGMAGLPLARIHGFVETTQGLGLVVEKITSRDGTLAPTLRNLIRGGLVSSRHVAALERFFSLCAREHIVFADLHAGNLVYTETRRPDGEFICVDGLGEKAAIPVHDWSRRINAMKVARVRGRILRGVERSIARAAATARAEAERSAP